MKGRCFAPLAAAVLLLSGCGDPRPIDMQPERPGEGLSVNGRWRFTDVTQEAGLGSFRHENGARGNYWMPETNGSGAAFLDYDGDGHLDIILVAGGFLNGEAAIPALELYRNTGNGTFQRQTEAAGLSTVVGYAQGVYVADIDNDGDDDLFVTNLGEDVLLRNDGGVFTDVSGQSGVASASEWSAAAAFLDADRDGYLDLFVGNYVEWSPEADLFCSIDGEAKDYCTPKAYPGVPSRFYVNNGDGTFSESTATSGIAGSAGNTLGAVAFDYNQDGWTDVYVANDLRRNLLYRNNGDGSFQEIAVQSGAAYDERGHARAGMGVDAGIVDATGLPTIFVGNFSNESIAAFRYTPADVFVSRDAASRLLQASLKTLTFGLFLFDANLDGHLDLLAVNGHVQTNIEQVRSDVFYRQPVHLFINQGDGTFQDAVPKLGAPLTTPLVGRGGAYGDFDGDGDVDILVVENGGAAHLWRNDLPETGSGNANYLRVDLSAQQSNRDAIGARVIVYVGGDGLEQQRRGGGSYLSTSEKTLTFGLGHSTSADSVVVIWPSGVRTVLREVPANQTLLVDETSLVEEAGLVEQNER